MRQIHTSELGTGWRGVIVSTAVVVIALVALLFAVDAVVDVDNPPPPALEVGQRYTITVPADPQPRQATYLGGCPGQACPGGGPAGPLPYHLFDVGGVGEHRRVAALYLVEWIEPVD